MTHRWAPISNGGIGRQSADRLEFDWNGAGGDWRVRTVWNLDGTAATVALAASTDLVFGSLEDGLALRAGE